MNGHFYKRNNLGGNVMSLVKKVILGCCAIGAGCAGYLLNRYGLNNTIHGQSTDATVEVEAVDTKPKTNTSVASSESSTSKNNKASKMKPHISNFNKAESNKSVPKKKSEPESNKKSDNESIVRKEQARAKRKAKRRRLYLTGRKTTKQYSASEIKRANQIYKHRSNLSFSECLRLARKG